MSVIYIIIIAITLLLNCGYVKFCFCDDDGASVDEIGYTDTFSTDDILTNSDEDGFVYTKDYSNTKQGGQLKISIEFDIQTQ